MTDRAELIDSARVFARLARLDAPSFVAAEVARRLDERLDVIRLDPATIVDAHSVPSGSAALLARRFPRAQRIELRCAPVPQPGLLKRLWRPRDEATRVLQAPLGSLPLAAGSAELVWSNLALHWHPAPHDVIPEWHRALASGGLLLFTAFGPDTLKEVATAFAAVDGYDHVLPFIDMHDYGDMLVAAGFETPVMDMEVMRLTYVRAQDLWSDVRALGGNALARRRRGLVGRGAGERLERALLGTRDAAGRYQLTFEIVSGHAWKGEPRRTAEGHAILRRVDRVPTRG